MFLKCILLNLEKQKKRDRSKKRAFVKYPAKFMVRKTGKKEYSLHGEY